jgi:hypothetical protein
MKKLLLALSVLELSICSLAQSGMPYLNYSAGNRNQSVYTPDSGCYTMDGSNLRKLDKQQNIVWQYGYNAIGFRNLLLSKTGSLFFLTDTMVGKINPATGNIIWTTAIDSITYTFNAAVRKGGIRTNQIFLDRNNQLVVTGVSVASYKTGIFMKLDTNGNVLNTKAICPILTSTVPFSPGIVMDNLFVINDSSGVYNCYYSAYNYMAGTTPYQLIYNSNTNTISYKQLDYTIAPPGLPFGTQYVKVDFYKSTKDARKFYLMYSAYNQNGTSYLAGLRQYNTVQKQKTFEAINAQYLEQKNFAEDKLGNMTLNFSQFNGSNMKWHLVNLDSNLNRTSSMYYFNHIGFAPNSRVIMHQFYPQKTFVELKGANFPANQYVLLDAYSTPTCVQSFTPGSTSICTALCGYASSVISPTLLLSATSHTSNFSTPKFNVSNTINQNFCPIAMQIDGVKNEVFGIKIYPSPTNAILTIEQLMDKLSTLFIYNEFGQLVRKIDIVSKLTNIDVKDLEAGCYFVQIKNGSEQHYIKFLKQ